MDILLLHKKLFWTDREDLKCMLLLFQQSLFVSYCVNFLPAEYVYRSGHKGVCVCVCVWVNPLHVLTDRCVAPPADGFSLLLTEEPRTRTKSRPVLILLRAICDEQICSDGVTASCSHAWTILSETYCMLACQSEGLLGHCHRLSNICSCWGWTQRPIHQTARGQRDKTEAH